MATRLLLQTPSKTFFFPETKNSLKQKIEARLHDLSFDVLAISFLSDVTAPDILWGQLHKTRYSIVKYLKRHDFMVFTNAVWSDEQGSHILLFSLASLQLPVTKEHIGPPFDTNDATAFVLKHLNAPTTQIGPWMGDGRWMVGKNRKYDDVRVLLTEQLTRNGGHTMGVAQGFVNSLKHQHTILVNQEIIALGINHPHFLPFFMTFLQGRPIWLHPKHVDE